MNDAASTHIIKPQGIKSWSVHARALARLGLPLIGAQLAQMAIHATDIAMVGRLGILEIGATTLATQYFFVIYMFGAGFLIAVSPLAAQAFGEGDEVGVRRATRMGLWIAIIYSVLTMPLLLAVKPLLLSLGQQPANVALADDYMRVAFLGLLPALLFVAMRSFLSAIDRSGILLWASIAAVLLNGALNYVFIYGNFGAPQMGVQGAALASVGTNIFIAGAVMLYAKIEVRAKTFSVFLRLWRADWPVFGSLLALGLPISLTIIAEVGLFQAATLMAGTLGEVPLAAHGIVLQLVSFAFMIPYGLSAALTVRIGAETGAKRSHDVRRAALAGLYVVIAWSLIALALFVLFPRPLIGIFLPQSDPAFAATMAIAVTILAIGAAFQLVDGLQAAAAGSLRGMKDTRVPMLIAIGSYWLIGVPFAYLTGIVWNYGIAGIWGGLAFGLAAAAIMLVARLLIRTKVPENNPV